VTSRRDLRWHYEVTTLASLPRAWDDLGETGHPCMSGPAWWRRVRWLASRRVRSDCCWHHRVDWHAVNKAAIRIARQAETNGTQPEDLAMAIDSVTCGGLAGDELEAVQGLFISGSAIEVNDDDPRDRNLQEGNHRVTAMRDARVRRTITLRSELIESAGYPSRATSGCRYEAVTRSVVFTQDGPGRPATVQRDGSART
jgi:hypothetical protein